MDSYDWQPRYFTSNIRRTRTSVDVTSLNKSDDRVHVFSTNYFPKILFSRSHPRMRVIYFNIKWSYAV